MSESLEFDDLELLGSDDLKAVFEQLEPDEVVAALWGTPLALRGRLLRTLPRQTATKIEQATAAAEHVTFQQVRAAQQKVIAVLCRLSRCGQIAFDVPEDLVA